MSLETEVERLLKGKKTVAVVCNQWGDSGKGKVIDVLADWAHFNIRGTGGANAGHTLVINGKPFVVHLIPSGILHDKEGKINIIGNNVAFDPRVAKEEIELLDQNGMSYDNLLIAYNAKLVLPYHLVLDRIGETGSGKIGTTGRGIGPLYTDHVARRGLLVNDMLNKDVFVRKMKRSLEDKITLLKAKDPEVVKEIMQHDHLLNGTFYSPETIFDVDAIEEQYMRYGQFFKKMVTDTDAFVREQVGKKRILLEGAQGALLSIRNDGLAPYVTSSDCTVSGLAQGAGLKESDVELTLGLVKAFYMTRVGRGPFPTEFGGKRSEDWCDAHKREDEERDYSFATVNHEDEFTQGIGIRFAGGEYGATTGRPRRTGWLDIPLLRRVKGENGSTIVLTKVDVLDDCDVIKVCESYTYQGPDYFLGNRVLHSGDTLSVAVLDGEVLKYCQPNCREFPGWKTSIRDIQRFEDLPEKLRNIIDYVENKGEFTVAMISVGPERHQTIVR